ncbi:hypothetical protein J31TS4_21060 [Paenibacillus sp. J31TS4]|uniref:hypothetical protein n=1 Tax=Paenibacillus sp. J31TS4 TaxID=2807195 RepID=UPI001B057BCE|nr:hypothetical protein [Paenibacillus sp. J31TS4]GIP38826.1 hypothetical protein J31TS4_21060 [Paenibacillus sp. J31TS4]
MPALVPSRKGGAVRKIKLTPKLNSVVRKRFSRLTVVWCNTAGVPFNTTGFFAILFTANGRRVSTAAFDSFGVVRFPNIVTPTRQRFVIRTFNRNGVLFRTRTIPAGVAAFVIIG